MSVCVTVIFNNLTYCSSNYRKSYAGASSSNSSRDSTTYIQASSALRSHPAQPRYQNINAHLSSQTQSCIKPGFKRKMAEGEDVERQQKNSAHYERSDDDRKRFQKSYAGPSNPGSSSRIQSCVSPRVKRKTAHDEDSDSDYYKRSDQERKRVRRSCAGRSTCSSSYESTHTLYARPDLRSGPAEHHCHIARPADSAQTGSRARSGLKRKAADDDDEWRRKRTSDHRSDNDRKRSAVRLEEDRRRRGE